MHPILLAGAVLAGLPILLHLILRQEPRRLPFPAVRFLKQRQRVNQRRMRLRHFLLLALRMLIIALFCATLYQPRVESSGLDLGGDSPVAAVLVLDTSPSMGYASADGTTRLAEARRRALELLDDLPSGSKAAVVDPADPLAAWEVSPADARRKVEALTEPHGAGVPVSSGIATAYQLLRTVDEESDSADHLPRLVAVFSDRAAASWDAARTDDLKRQLGLVPPPAVAHLLVDVGVDKPADVGILAAELHPQLVPQGQPVALTVTLQATGPDVPSAGIRCTLDGDAATAQRATSALSAGTPAAVTFTFRHLPPGVHQAELRLESPDALSADDVRYVTFRVGEARKILTITDHPDDAAFWQLAHREKGEFSADVVTPEQVRDLGGYEVVALLNVSDPTQPVSAAGNKPLWELLREYVDRGGKLIVMPGGPNHIALDAYDPVKVPGGLLPGKLRRVVDAATEYPEPPKGDPKAPDRRRGVAWVVPDNPRHSLLAPFREWRLRGTVDFLRNPRLASRYWEVEAPPESVVVAYDSSDDPVKRHPAVLEKEFPHGGKVLLLTTRMDPQWDERWNNYWELAESSWAVVFPNLLVRYLAGDSADAAYNFTTGQAVAVPPPKGDILRGKKLVLEGPGVTGRDTIPEIGDRQAELRLSPAQTLTAGNFLLRTEDGSWREGFSLNPPSDEFTLEKAPAEAIESLFGPNSIVPVEKDVRLADTLSSHGNPELRLFPWLLIGVLIVFALEGFVANRFYRLRGAA